MKVVILGCGTSSGVPRIGNDWGDCDPNEIRNLRSRASVLIEADGYRILVDTGPDLRNQLLANNISRVDAVLYTHDHADHCHGIDDLRQIYHQLGHPVPIYARPWTLASLRSRFGYAFDGKESYPPLATGHELPDHLTLGPIDIDVVDHPHGSITSAGMRFNRAGRSIAYSTDLSDLTNNAINAFQGLDLWVVDALRRRPHPTHPHLDKTLSWIKLLEPTQAVLTHMDQSMDYKTLAAELPKHIQPGYDGLVIEI